MASRLAPWIVAGLIVVVYVLQSTGSAPMAAAPEPLSPFNIDENGAPALVVNVGGGFNQTDVAPVADEPDASEEASNPPTVDFQGADALVAQCRAGTRRASHPGVGSSSARVQFIHVPKAGGTSVQRSLMQWCGKTEKCSMMIFDGSSYGSSSSRCPPLVQVKTLLTGHRGYGYCRDVQANKKRGLVTFVVLREPVSRIRSLFDYRLLKLGVLGKQTDDLSDAIVRFNSTLEIEKGEERLRALGMQQARFLCGFHCMGPEADVMARSNASKEHVTRTIVAKAMHNLLRVDAVGVLERFTELLPQLKYQLDWVPMNVHGWPKENTAAPHDKTVLTPQAVEILREWNRPDTEVYQLADKIAKRKTSEALKCLKHLREAGDLKSVST